MFAKAVSRRVSLARSFGAMDTYNHDLMEHTFTKDMTFRSKFDKFQCFRVMDSDGVITNKPYENAIPDEQLLKMHDCMVTMNEVDQVYNAAQRQSRISFYMTQSGEEASGVGTAAGVQSQDLMFPQYREAGAFLWRGFSV
jgi:2-oxoisovalerate dehydrogenase E1 component alpha subunit